MVDGPLQTATPGLGKPYVLPETGVTEYSIGPHRNIFFLGLRAPIGIGNPISGL